MRKSLRAAGLALCLACFFLLGPTLAAQAAPTLFGAVSGLYRLEKDGTASRLWGPGEARKIMRTKAGWFILSGSGVTFSADLTAFSERNQGLPFKTLKVFKDGVKSFTREVQDLKDLECDPDDDSVLVSCSKDEIFLSRDSGLSWSRLETPVPMISGLKAVAVFSRPKLTIMASHPIKGLWSICPDDKSPAWTPCNAGLNLIPSTTMVDEIADIKAVRSGDGVALYASGSFQPTLYVRDPGAKAFRALYAKPADFGMLESIQMLKGAVGFVSDDCAFSVSANVTGTPASLASPWDEADREAARASAALGSGIECLYYETADGPVSLSELWLLKREYSPPNAGKLKGLKGIYLQTGFVNTKLDYYRQLMKERGINMLTVDMKDDFGRLRFEPKSDVIKAMSRTVNPIDVEKFVSTMKADGVYLVARLVVFKDQVVYNYSGGKYAVLDSTTNQPWQGYNLSEKPQPSPSPAAMKLLPNGVYIPQAAASPSATPQPEYEKNMIGEYWVDPYCEQVWRYNVEIAKEMIERGFDEVQFDYIRFPTDGANLADASYRFRDPGMDKESALMSFLSFARENIKAPISVDIYGANGYYRTGVRTGQDVEILKRYVDVICPMYYPSHFEQDFYAMKPEIERQYRIYYYGTFRNTYIGRYRVVVRPWVQAFSMNVRQDRKYYGPDYVLREIKGIKDSANSGLTFWNNAGRYDDIPFAQGAAQPVAKSAQAQASQTAGQATPQAAAKPAAAKATTNAGSSSLLD